MRRDGAINLFYAALSDPKAPDIRVLEADLTILTRAVTLGKVDLDPSAPHPAGGSGGQSPPAVHGDFQGSPITKGDTDALAFSGNGPLLGGVSVA